MTTLRAVLRKLAGQRTGGTEKLRPDKVDYAYRIFWTKTAREWDEGRRARVALAIQGVIGRPDFEKNLMARRYEVPELDDGLAHSGASLLALAEVLEALSIHVKQEN